MALKGKTNAEKVWNYFKGKGFNDFGIAGLMGNIEAESNFKSTNLQQTYEKSLKMTDDEYTKAVDNGTYTNFVKDSAGYGLAQWTYWSRKQNLLNYAKKRGKSIGDLEMQLEFLYSELKGYKAVFNVLTTAKTVREASDIVLHKYEQPADQSEAVEKKRAGYGQKYYDLYAENIVQEDKKEEVVTENCYSVQCGMYSIKTNADAMVRRLKVKGFDATITQINKNYRVHVGFYPEKKEAEAMLKQIKAKGFDAYVIYVEGVDKGDSNKDTNKTYLVAIDAGHGSDTAGKRTPDQYKEHWINNHTAIYFDKAMQRCGIKTLKVAWDDYDATDDTDVPLSTRQMQIKNAGCDISVSWHANAFGNGDTYNSGQGVETYYNSISSRAGDSKKLATKVQSYLVKGTTQKNRGVKSANFAMCNCTAMGTKASILIEIGFMTNEHEAELLMTDKFCYECAEEAAQGVCEYLGVNYVKGTFAEIDVKIGDYNKNVPLAINKSTKDIQKFLNQYYGKEIKQVLGGLLVVNGNMDVRLKKALVVAFQVELNKLGANLNVNGDFDAKTATAFTKYVGNLKLNTKGIFVTLWQCILVSNNLELDGIDGVYDANCMAATFKLFAKLDIIKEIVVSGDDLNKVL